MTNTEIARRIVERHQYEEIDGVLIDAMTAQAIVAVSNALTEGPAANPERLAQFDAWPIEKAARLAWKVVR